MRSVEATARRNRRRCDRRRELVAERSAGKLTPAEAFDWDRAIAGANRIWAEVDAKYPRSRRRSA
jgi:hypothetical protein